MLIPGIQRNYPEIKKGGKPLFLYGKDRGLRDFRRMFHVKHSGNDGNTGYNPSDGFSGRKHGAFGSGPRIFLLGIFGKNDIIKYMFQEIFRIV